ncbi:uncharacterized protein LOC131626354 isoform X1 [Vicia villosa]|uniref:uncharacterized protein LOC131626354 isoform X1 n=1 Tax=Vicia villosa TaxID=3911 RepID=UPI00273A8504|nr:uncharacterized protein LOC131626354 isoform X1 [Vicia villosa]
MTSDGADTSKYSTSFGKSFSFKFEDPIGRMNRINCGNCLGETLGRLGLYLVCFCLVCLPPTSCALSLNMGYVILCSSLPTLILIGTQLFMLLFFVGTEHLDEQAVMLRVVIKDRELPEICRSEGFKVAFGFRQFSQTNTNLWYSH